MHKFHIMLMNSLLVLSQFLSCFYVGVAHINAQLFPLFCYCVWCPDFLVTDSVTRGLSGSKESAFVLWDMWGKSGCCR